MKSQLGNLCLTLLLVLGCCLILVAQYTVANPVSIHLLAAGVLCLILHTQICRHLDLEKAGQRAEEAEQARQRGLEREHEQNQRALWDIEMHKITLHLLSRVEATKYDAMLACGCETCTHNVLCTLAPPPVEYKAIRN